MDECKNTPFTYKISTNSPKIDFPSNPQLPANFEANQTKKTGIHSHSYIYHFSIQGVNSPSCCWQIFDKKVPFFHRKVTF